MPHSEPNDRGCFKGGPRGRGEAGRPRQNRVAHGRRNSARTCGQHLSHKKGISTRAVVEYGRIECTADRHVRTALALSGSGMIRQTACAVARSPKTIRSGWLESHFVVTKRGNQKDRQTADTAGQEPEQIEGRFIGPVDILENQNCRPGCLYDQIEQGIENRPRAWPP